MPRRSSTDKEHLVIRKLAPLALASALIAFSPLALAEPRTVTLEVSNMTCAVCPITVKQALTRVPGVLAAKVDFDTKTATVRYESSQTSVEAISSATGNAGYPSRVVKGVR